jgi:hypothetical protein
MPAVALNLFKKICRLFSMVKRCVRRKILRFILSKRVLLNKPKDKANKLPAMDICIARLLWKNDVIIKDNGIISIVGTGLGNILFGGRMFQIVSKLPSILEL